MTIIAILARAPQAGAAKTRLIPLLGPVGAARLQLGMLRRTIVTALSAKVGPVTIWCAPDRTQAAFAECAARWPITLVDQPDGDLGTRMRLASHASPDGEGTLVVGTDCPALRPSHLRTAAACLAKGDDAAIIPAEDGGYVLIALARDTPEAFRGIDWGGPMVLEQTRKQLISAGLRFSELQTLWDVDRPEDYLRLMRTGIQLDLSPA